jgi:hypothetical protein
VLADAVRHGEKLRGRGVPVKSDFAQSMENKEHETLR